MSLPLGCKRPPCLKSQYTEGEHFNGYSPNWLGKSLSLDSDESFLGLEGAVILHAENQEPPLANAAQAAEAFFRLLIP